MRQIDSTKPPRSQSLLSRLEEYDAKYPFDLFVWGALLGFAVVILTLIILFLASLV